MVKRRGCASSAPANAAKAAGSSVVTETSAAGASSQIACRAVCRQANSAAELSADADHDGDGRRAGDRRCGADAAHGLGGRDHLLRCKDSFPDGEAAGLCLERPGQCRESGRIVSRNGDIGSRGLIADGVQGRLQAGKLCRRTLGGRHQHDVTGVGILALHTPLPQSLCQLLAGKTQRGGVQRQLEGFTVRPGEGSCRPEPRWRRPATAK